MQWIALVLLCSLLATTVSYGEELTPEDQKNIYKQKTVEHILYENYLRSDNGPVSVMGYHFDAYLSDNLFTTLAIFGAIAGNRGGYGIAAMGAGYNTRLTDRFSLEGKLLVGSGGGGGVPAGGGLAIEPQAGVAYEFIDNLCFRIMMGKLYFPSGNFSSPIVNLGITHTFYQVKLPY